MNFLDLEITAAPKKCDPPPMAQAIHDDFDATRGEPSERDAPLTNVILDHDVLKRSPFHTMRFLTELSSESVIGVNALRLIVECLCYGGFIAGGAALLAYTIEFGIGSNVDLDEYLSNRKGDIDIFFPTVEQAMACADRLERSGVRSALSAQRTENSFMYNVGGIRIQFITCHYADPQTMFRTFDISNACVALTEKEILRPGGYDSFIFGQDIHVQKWNKNTSRRVQKWFMKQQPRFLKLHKSNHQEFMERVPEGDLDSGLNANANDDYDNFLGP